MGKFVDLTGKQFGKWTVLELSQSKKNRRYWKCQCSCEKQTVRDVAANTLMRGKSLSCGCSEKGLKHIKARDLTGQVFDYWTVLEYGYAENKIKFWKCVCLCGTIKFIRQGNLLNGTSTSCGCRQQRIIDLVGQKFGRLLVISLYDRTPHKRITWLCQCDCGKETIVNGGSLKSGNTKSCGCLNLEVLYKKVLPDGEGAFNQICNSYKRGAKIRGIYFNLSKDEIRSLISQNCYYCGAEPSQTKYSRGNLGDNYVHNGIDRIDSSKGYEIENVVPCCRDCNCAKLSMPRSQFLDWIERVYNYSIKGKFND